VQIIDLLMIVLACIASIVGFLVVCRIRNLKAHFVEQHRERFDQVLTSIGEIDSLGEARLRAPLIVEIMKRYDATGLMVPLKSGGKVSFQLECAGSLRIEDK
jgi:hypothetical protein